jgi:hypothetical protein
VIGYWQHPLEELKRLKTYLKNQNSILMLSFTSKASRGYAEQIEGNMRCFDVHEVTHLLKQSGYLVDTLWNYGFPLANLLKPLLNLYHRLKEALHTVPRTQQTQMEQSGLRQEPYSLRLIFFIMEHVILGPFALMQLLFKTSHLGTGYVVLARPNTSEQSTL